MRKYYKNNYPIFLITFILLITINLFYFRNIVSIDTEDALLHPNIYFYGWASFNRFSLVYFNIFLSKFGFNILLRRIITFIIFYFSITIFSYIFTKWINKLDKKILFIIIMLLGSSPIFAEQFNFTLQSIPIAIGFLLLSISLLSYDKYNSSKKNRYLIVFILFSIICFGLYQAFIQLYLSIIIFYLLITINDKKEFKKEIIKNIIIFMIIFLLYYLISYFTKRIFESNSGGYLNSFIRWKELGFFSSIIHIGYYCFRSMIGLTYYHLLSFTIFLIIGFRYLYKNKKLISFFLLFCLFISPFLLTILSASETFYRAQFSYIFTFVFIVLYVYKSIDLKKILYFLLIFAIIKQSLLTFSLLYYDDIRFKDDYKLGKYIVELNKKYDKEVVLVGAYHRNKNVKIKGETLGHSFASWDFESDYGVNGRMHSFMKTQNIDAKLASVDIYQKVKYEINDSVYPEKNCYKIYDDYIIIFL